MSKTVAPLLSFGAGGQLARTTVYASWKGIPYARRYVVPANPRTTRQVVTRSLFKFLQGLWLMMPSAGKDPWTAAAVGKPFTPVNKFTSSNVKGVDTMTPPTNMSAFIGSPGAKGGLPLAGIVVTPGSTQLSVACTVPAAPSGWTIAKVVGIAFLNTDPADPFTGVVTTAEDATAPYTVVFTGLTASVPYVVSLWIEWTRADGTTAYGPSSTSTGTPTV